MRNTGLDEAQAGITIAGRNIHISDMQMTPPLWFCLWRRTKELLDESERGEWKSWFKIQHSKNEGHGIQFHHFIASRWRNSGSRDRLYFLGSKITADDDCSHKIKRRLLLGRKAMTNLDRILKSRDIIWLTKVCIVKVMIFPVVI